MSRRWFGTAQGDSDAKRISRDEQIARLLTTASRLMPKEHSHNSSLVKAISYQYLNEARTISDLIGANTPQMQPSTLEDVDELLDSVTSSVVDSNLVKEQLPMAKQVFEFVMQSKASSHAAAENTARVDFPIISGSVTPSADGSVVIKSSERGWIAADAEGHKSFYYKVGDREFFVCFCGYAPLDIKINLLAFLATIKVKGLQSHTFNVVEGKLVMNDIVRGKWATTDAAKLPLLRLKYGRSA